MIESIKKVVKKENLNEKEAFEIMLEFSCFVNIAFMLSLLKTGN